jgi:serine/threonine protein kinase
VALTGLVSPQVLRATRAVVAPEPAEDAAVRMARALVEQGALTPYQAKKILGGATKGFVLGSYRVLRRIGEGGMGKVFLARKGTDGPQVAIKVLPPRKALEDPRALERFVREARLSQRVIHPAIARTNEFGTQDGVHYLVMEYVPGDSLYHLVKSRGGGPWRVPDAVKYFLKVLKGLEAAHAAGVIHRDIKPSNLMVTPDGGAKILDLGLARALDEVESGRLTRDFAIVGTLDYASPEQVSDAARADARSDIYSLGCTLYFTLAGKPPFPGGDAINKIYKQRMEDAPPLEQVARGVPAAFAAIVRKMMAKEPADRYASCAEARADLKRWSDPEVVRSLVGAEADAARAFRPPPPEIDEDDLRLLDAPSGSPMRSSSILKDLGSSEAAPAPRNPPPVLPRRIRPSSRPASTTPTDHPADSRLALSLPQLLAGLALLAVLTVILFWWLRRS